MVVESSSVRQAVILAGGAGVRMRPLTEYTPKCLIKINGIPFLDYLLKLLEREGIEEVIILLGYMAPTVISYIHYNKDRYKLNIQIVIGEVSDYTGKRVRDVYGLLNDTFLLLYCDNYWELNLKKMIDYFTTNNLKMTVTSYNNINGDGEYGNENNLSISDDDKVLNYDYTRQSTNLNGTDIGFYLINKEILKYMPTNNFSLENDFLPIMISKGELNAFKTNRPYCNLTDMESIKKVEQFLKDKK